jgi:hypothetical protein
MTVAVSKAINHLFDRLLEENTVVEEANAISESVGNIATAYPTVWCESTKTRLSQIKPSSQQLGWSRMLCVFSTCRPFPVLPDSDLEPIVELCTTSIFSVDVGVRTAGLIGLKAIASSNSRIVLAKIAFSLKIYTLNNHVVDLLEYLGTVLNDSVQVKKLLNLIYMLFSEEGAVREDLLGDLACCIAPCCLPAQQETLSKLSELLTPMCWRKDLVASGSSSLFGLFKAVSSMMTVVPPFGGAGTIHAVQSGVLRLLVHTKNAEELIKALETVKILTTSGNMLVSEEMCNACIPILIDIGIAVGPLALLGAVDTSRTVQRALHEVWLFMSARGTAFILDRATQASQLSTVDRVVTLVFLNWAIQGNSITAQRADVLVSCIDQLCSITGIDASLPYLSMCVLELVASSCCKIPSFLLTVPIIDFVIGLAILPKASTEPSTIKTYLFSSSSDVGATGPSQCAVQERAQTVLVLLSEAAGKDSLPALRERSLDTVIKKLPIAGLESLVKTLIGIGDPIKDTGGPHLLYWAHVHLENPALMAELTKLVVPHSTTLSKSLHAPVIESMFEFSLSRKFLEKTGRVLRAFEISRDVLVPILPDGCGGRTLIQCLQKCDQELVSLAASTMGEEQKFVTTLGSLVGRLPFAEFQHVMNEMTAFLGKSRNRLVVLMGLKKNSSEIIFAILRAALGFSVSSTTKLSELVPVLHDMYLLPCYETIREIRGEPDTLPVITTLETLIRVVPAVSTIIVQTDGGEFVNSLIASILPLIVFHAQRETPIVRLAMEAVTALASVPQLTLSTVNFDLSVQYSVSVLVHGISNFFSTLETDPYDERIVAVSSLLVAVLSHSFNVWLGLSRLAQLLHLAGASSPLPILRVVCMKVYARVVSEIVQQDGFDIQKSTILEWIESLVIVIPRLRDPTTSAIAREVLKRIFSARKIECVYENVEIFSDKNIVPDSELLAFVQLLLHAAATDASHEAAVYVLHILNHLILARGQGGISVHDSPGLVSVMLGHADKQVSVQSEFLECVHAISSVHLSASLTEIISESVISGGGSFSDSQLGAIHSIAREKKLLVGFVQYMTDLMNNSEPSSDGAWSKESLMAGKALDAALNVNDSLVPVMVGKFAAPLVGTALLHAPSTELVRTVLKRLNISVPKEVGDHEQLLIIFLNGASSESQIASLAEFFIPFLSRDPRGKACLEAQRKTSENFLARLVDRITDTAVLTKIKVAFREVRSVVGLREILDKRGSLFQQGDLDLVIDILREATEPVLLGECLVLLLMATEQASRMNGEEGWRKSLLSTGPIFTEILSKRLISDDSAVNMNLFKQTVTLVSGLSDIATIVPNLSEEFTRSVSESLLVALEIRMSVLEDLGEHTDLCARTVVKLQKLCPHKRFTYEDFDKILRFYLDPRTAVEFPSMSSPSRSPLVVKGAARLAVEIANGTDLKSEIVRTLLKFLKTQKKSFIFDAAKEHIIEALGDLKVL